MKIVLLVLMILLSSCTLFKKRAKTPTVGDRLPVLTLSTKIEADPALAETIVVVPPAEANAEWTQPGVGPTKSAGNLELSATLVQAWVAEIGQGSSKTRRLSSAPVVADGRVYTIDTSASVRAFAVLDGREVWRATIARAGDGERVAFGGGVSFGAGRVYATSGYGIVAAFDAATGKPLWRTDVGAPLRGSPAATAERVFAISQDNQIFALNPATGARLWDVAGTIEQAGLLGVGTPAVSGETVVAGFSSGELVALLAANGRSVWQDALARTGRSTAIASLADIDAAPVIDRDRVFAIGHGGRMVSLELTTGNRVWERNFAGVSMPWVAGEWVFAVTLDGEIVALTRSEGRVRWVTQLPAYRKAKAKKGDIRWYGPVLASDKLWVAGSHGRMGWIDPANGKLGDTWPLPGATYLPPVIAGGMLFILTDEGRLVAFRGAGAVSTGG